MFMDIIFQLINKRKDLGFILPSVVSILPVNFFPGELLDKAAQERKDEQEMSNRVKRDVYSSDQWDRGRKPRVFYWNRKWPKTMPDDEPESRLRYFYEDPMANAAHYYWHQVLSSESEVESHLHSSHLDRRGEMFFFVHRQMLARLNNERISVGLPLVESFGPVRWSKRVYPGYDPKLGRASVEKFMGRKSGATMYPHWQNSLWNVTSLIRMAIERGEVILGENRFSLQYIDGVDYGIIPLGDVIESYVPSSYGELHNMGHATLSKLHKGEGVGVLNSPSVAMRDPLFGQWHKFVDDEFMKYKTRLGYYHDVDLDFPGVHVYIVELKSLNGDKLNTLTTFMDHEASVQLSSVDFEENERPVEIRYSRLDHVSFSYTYYIHSYHYEARGICRTFMIPANVSIQAEVDITQVAIEIDRFHFTLNRGHNTIVRHSNESPFLGKSNEPLHGLQQRFLRGQVSEAQFNQAGCGWPQELLLPRGSSHGAVYYIFAIFSPLLKNDKAHTADLPTLSKRSWAWCGLRKDAGGMPDSRPMGFPFDRPPPAGKWQALATRLDGNRRGNVAVTTVRIFHKTNS